MQLLVRIVALLQSQLQQQQVKRIPFPPLPRVRTARDVVRQMRRGRHRNRLLSLLEQAHARYAAEQSAGRPAADEPVDQVVVDQVVLDAT